MPIMLEQVFGRGAAAIGFIIFPGAMLSAIAAIYVGRLMDAYGNVKLLFLSQGLLMISAFIFFFLAGKSPYMIMIAYMFTASGFQAFHPAQQMKCQESYRQNRLVRALVLNNRPTLLAVPPVLFSLVFY